MWHWSCTIDDWRPDPGLSLNGRRRLSIWTVAKLTRQAKERATWAIREHEGKHPHRGHHPEQLAVEITFGYRTQRRRDPDGLAGLAKPILDALVAEHVLLDDDSAHIDLRVRAETGPHDYTRIFLSERGT